MGDPGSRPGQHFFMTRGGRHKHLKKKKSAPLNGFLLSIIMQRHYWSSTSPKEHVTPLFVSLHWLPVAARIQFKTLMLAYRTTTGSAPTYFHSLLRIYIPSRSLRSASERRLVVPSQRGSKSLSRTFSFNVPGWWNDLPPHHPECWIPVNLQATTENSSLSTLLDFIIKKVKKKKKEKFYIFIFLFTFLSFLC